MTNDDERKSRKESLNKNFSSSFGKEKGSGKGKFSLAVDVSVEWCIYVCDQSNYRIQLF